MSDGISGGLVSSAWLVLEVDLTTTTFPYPDYVAELYSECTRYGAIAEGDWILVCGVSGKVQRVARVMRARSNLQGTTLYFDKLAVLPVAASLHDLSITSPATGAISRLQWTAFIAALPKLGFLAIDDVPLVGHQAYTRELLQLAAIDDLLGPANGPHDKILEMGVRDRYLHGKLLSFVSVD